LIINKNYFASHSSNNARRQRTELTNSCRIIRIKQEGKWAKYMQVEMFKLVIRVFFIISTIVTATGFVLFISILKRKKYSNMTIGESPLLKHLIIITAGFTVMVICNLLTIIIGY
jgi:hypothetical protein